MPWSVSNPPNVAQNWTQSEKEKCVAAANAALEAGESDENAIYACIHAAGKGDKQFMEKREEKSFPAYVIKADKEQGIVDAIVAVMGNIDHGEDVIHPGAFTKTITERRGKIRVLDNHNMNSVRDVIGKCLEIHEVSKSELPEYITKNYPDANGGLFTKTQYLLDTPEGLGAFKRIESGAIDEYSIAFSIPRSKFDYSDVENNGTKTKVRNIREVKLFEYSPVILGMNSATTTISAKNEQKELSLFERYDETCEAFDEIYMDMMTYTGYCCIDVYDSYLFARPCNIETEYELYKVSYTHDDLYENFVFSNIQDWQGGNYQFVIGAKSLEEIKAGRMISSANMSKLQAAIDALTDLMNVASQDMLDNSEHNMNNDKSNLVDTDNVPVTPITYTKEQLDLLRQKHLLYLEINRNKN